MDAAQVPGVGMDDHQLTLPGKRGLRLKPLVFRPDPPPLPDESLLGLLARAAGRNGFTSLTKVLRLADIGTGTPENLPNIDAGTAERLAFLLKVPVAEVTARTHPRVVRADARGDFIDFFGVPLRARYREKSRRRVSPRALAVSPHHRAIHDLRPFSFCPETWETLIDACPVCRKPLRWLRAKGVAFCEHCVSADDEPLVDLRDFPQPLVQVGDAAALRFVTDLVHPDPGLRAKALANADPRLAGFGPGDLFELVVRLALAVATPPEAHYMELRRLKERGDFAVLAPDLLARAGRAVMDWSTGFAALADAMRSQADARPSHFGVIKELGPLRLVARQRGLPAGLRSCVAEAVRADMERTAAAPPAPRRRALRHRTDLIDSATAAKRLGVKGGLMGRLARHADVAVVRTAGRRALVLFEAEQIEAIRAVRRDMVDAPAAARLTGLPVRALAALAEAGMVERAEGPVLALVSGRTHYRLGGLHDLLRAAGQACRAGEDGGDWRRLDAALRQLPPGEKPWVALVRALLDGPLPACAGDGEDGLFARLRVPPDRLTELVGTAGAAAGGDGEMLSYREAAAVIGLSVPTVTWLVAAGLLPTTGEHDRRLTRAALLRFNAEYVPTREVARRLGIHPSRVRGVLSGQGIEPACALRGGMRLIWHRDHVLRALKTGNNMVEF